jgi:sec-independent protein translocase protein TatC
VATRTQRARNREGRMSLAEHLLELRKRLVIGAVAILVGSVAGFFLTPAVFAAMQAPINAVAKQHNASINYTVLTEAFDIQLQIAITIGVVISSPVWLWQIWSFILPALVRREKVYALGFFFTAVPLFLGGAIAGWFIFPHMAQLLLGFAQSNTSTILTAKYLVDFILKLVLGVGVGFTFPVFLVLLNFIGVLEAKSILNSWRIAIIAIAFFTALVTPSADVLSMFILAIPMVVLYFGAVLVATLHDRGVARRASELDAELSAP